MRNEWPECPECGRLSGLFCRCRTVQNENKVGHILARRLGEKTSFPLRLCAFVREWIMLSDTPKCRSADGCPVYYAGRMGRNRGPEGLCSVITGIGKRLPQKATLQGCLPRLRDGRLQDVNIRNIPGVWLESSLKTIYMGWVRLRITYWLLSGSSLVFLKASLLHLVNTNVFLSSINHSKSSPFSIFMASAIAVGITTLNARLVGLWPFCIFTLYPT